VKRLDRLGGLFRHIMDGVLNERNVCVTPSYRETTKSREVENNDG
jgi:hypothetical protein